jgi:hypothetical protein
MLYFNHFIYGKAGCFAPVESMGFYEAKRQNDAIKLEPDLKGYRAKFSAD